MDGRLQFDKVKDRRNNAFEINFFVVQTSLEKQDIPWVWRLPKHNKCKQPLQIVFLSMHKFFQVTKHLTSKPNALFLIVISQSFNLYSSRFVHDRCVGTFMARIGQCFSTSMDAVGIDVNEGTSWEMDEDIKTSDGSYCFSDGVGRISQTLAQQVTRKRNSDVFCSRLRSEEVKARLT